MNEYTRNRADILHALTRPQVSATHCRTYLTDIASPSNFLFLHILTSIPTYPHTTYDTIAYTYHLILPLPPLLILPCIPYNTLQDVVEFLRMNSLRGNVLVNKDLLTHVLQQSKTVIERFKGALMLT